MATDKQYKILLKDNFFRRIVRFLAKKCGYICVPLDYPTWILKSATTQERIASTESVRKFVYREGDHNGRAHAYREVAKEIENFGKN